MKNIDYQALIAKITLFFGGGLFALFGEFNELFAILVIMMIVDYLVGTLLAGVGLSTKSENGSIKSNEIWKGIAKKVGVLVIVMITKLVGDVMSFEKLRDIVIFGYITFEVTSLLEHAKIVGIPLPKALLDMLEVMKSKEKEGIEIEEN